MRARRWLARASLLVLTAAATVHPAGPATGAPRASGDLLWATPYDGPAHMSDTAYAVASSPNGSTAYVTGGSYVSPFDSDYVTAAYDTSTGSELWSTRYDGPFHSFDTALAIAVSPDGSRVFVTGESIGSSGYYDLTTIAYDASDGSPLWTARYDGTGHKDDGGVALAMSSDGTTVFVTGYSRGASSSDDFITIAYDAADGTPRWQRRLNGPGNRFDRPTGLAVAPNASLLFVAGFVAVGSTSDYATVAYDAATGAKVWVKTYDGTGHNSDGANAIAVTPDGSTLVVTGDSTSPNLTDDYTTIAYDAASGTRKWLKRYNGQANGDDQARSIAVTPDGSRSEEHTSELQSHA